MFRAKTTPHKDRPMKNQWIAAALLITAAPLAQAGLFDVLSQASQVMKTVQTTRDAVAPAQPAPAAAPTAAIDPQALQAYLGMDCATLKGAQASLAQQAAPSTAAKATGLLNSASGLLGFAGRMAGRPHRQILLLSPTRRCQGPGTIPAPQDWPEPLYCALWLGVGWCR
jgi:hypothetical protein